MNIQSLVKRLSQDKHSSATHITAYTCEALRKILPRLKAAQIRNLLIQIPHCQPAMAPLYVLCDTLLKELKKGADGKTLGSLAFEFLSDLGAHVYQVTSKTASQIRSGSKILTYSASSVVLKTLLKALKLGKKFTVYISEARPACEGIWAAKKLKDWEIKTILMTDLALMNQVSSVDLILLGADAILPKTLIHKVGTRTLVQIARIEKVPVWVLTTREKFLNASQAKRLKIGSRFDATPLEWITKIMS